MFASPTRMLLTIDPGLQRTHAAGRATLAVAAALAVSYSIIRASGQAPLLAMVAVFVALQMSLRPSARPRLQLRTELLGWAVSIASLTLGVVLLVHPAAAAVGFVVVMAASTWASGYGPPGLTIGIVAFVTYLFTQFAAPSPADLPWLLLAATIGVALASVVRHLVLPDRPRRILTWLLAALREEAGQLVTSASNGEAGAAGGSGSQRKRAETIDTIVLQLHDLLDAHPSVVNDERQFHRDLFAVVTLTHLLVLQVEGAARADRTALLPPPAEPATRLELYLSALESAATGAGPSRTGEREVALAGEQALREPEPIAPAEAEAGPRGWLTGHRRRALQVAMAGVLAIGAGVALSPDRWYWAPMTSFFVFANANSRGATLRKAIERTVGTVGGIAGGLLLGSVLAGHTRLQLIAVFPLLFLGFWLLPVSYALMTVFLTSLLALLYAMMSILTLDLLLLRLGETAIGAAIGVVVAYLLLPARTRNAVDDALRAFFAAMDELFAALPEAADRTPPAESRVLESVRRLDRATGTLATTVNPVSEAVPGRRARILRQELILALTARYWTHRIAARVLFQPDTGDLSNLDRLVAGVRGRLTNLQNGTSSGERPARPESAATAMEAALRRLETVLAALARIRAQRN